MRYSWKFFPSAFVFSQNEKNVYLQSPIIFNQYICITHVSVAYLDPAKRLNWSFYWEKNEQLTRLLF